MSKSDSTLQGKDLRKAILTRLQFEQAMGIRSIRPTELAIQESKQSVPKATAPAISAEVHQSPGSLPIDKDKETRWKTIEAQAKQCSKCVLANKRTNVVFGDGNRNAKLMFIGEGPGADEDRQGIPFVGRAGQLLNKIITAMGFERKDVYICNVVKCRPPNNRTPSTEEANACWPYLEEQIKLVEPQVIVCLGAPAAKLLLNTATGISRLRGQWHAFKGIPVMPTFHPAYVLRRYEESPEAKLETRKQVWSDMQQVLERLK